jgi:hypothetical protein
MWPLVALSRPVRRLLRHNDAAFRQGSEPSMKLVIEQSLRHLVAPFEMSHIWSSVIRVRNTR